MDTEIIAGRCCCRIKYVWKTWSKKGQWCKKLLPKYQTGVKDCHFPRHLWTIHIMTCYYFNDYNIHVKCKI